MSAIRKNCVEEDPTGQRLCVITIKVTTAEKLQLNKFAVDNCINLSALVRKLLFDALARR